MPRTYIEIKVPYADLLLRHAPFQPITELHKGGDFNHAHMCWVLRSLESSNWEGMNHRTARRWFQQMTKRMSPEIHTMLEKVRDDTRGVLPSRQLTQLLTDVNIFEVEKVPILLPEIVLFNEQTFSVTVENDYLHLLMFERPEAGAEF